MEHDASMIAREGLDARSWGHYDKAERRFQEALQLSSNPVQEADIMLNLADTIRRDGERIDDARQILTRARQKTNGAMQESIEAVKVHAAVIHHLARLERQAGNTEDAVQLLSFALLLLGEYLKQIWWRKPFPIDVVTMRLDMASVLVLDGHPWQARSYALRALVWMAYPWFWPELSKAHFGRAAILFAWAKIPINFDELFMYPRLKVYVYRAFFGRTAGD